MVTNKRFPEARKQVSGLEVNNEGKAATQCPIQNITP